MVRAGALTHGSVVRYNNKLYYIFRVSYAETKPAFIEYNVWNITCDAYKKEFYLDIEKGEYEDYQTSDREFKRGLFKKVFREAVLVKPEDVEAAYIDCLNALYTQAVTRTLSFEDRNAREALHCVRLKELLKESCLNLAADLYKCAGSGHNCCTITPNCTEDAITSYGKYPVYYNFPCVDGVQRSTFPAYVSYIFFRAFGKACGQTQGEDELEQTTDQDRIGSMLVAQIRAIFRGLHLEWVSSPGKPLPNIVVFWNKPTVGELLM